MTRAYVCVSMCVCVCVCLCVQMFLWSLSPLRLCVIDTHTHTHTHTWRVCDYLLMYKKKKDTSIYIYICMHKYIMWYMFICVCRYVQVYVYLCVSVYVSMIGLCRRPGCVYSLPLWPKLICAHMHTLCISCLEALYTP